MLSPSTLHSNMKIETRQNVKIGFTILKKHDFKDLASRLSTECQRR